MSRTSPDGLAWLVWIQAAQWKSKQVTERTESQKRKDDSTGKIIDYVYEMYPSAQFCDEILTLNKHNKRIEIQGGKRIVENVEVTSEYYQNIYDSLDDKSIAKAYIKDKDKCNIQ